MPVPRPLAALGLLLVLLAAPQAAGQCATQRIDVAHLQLLPDFTYLGQSIDLSGDRLASASFEEWVNLPGSGLPVAKGAVYLHRRVDGEWQLEERLTLEGFGNSDVYGYTVALDGDVLAVGVPSACVGDPIVGACDPGRVVVYEHGARGWELVDILTPADSSVDDVFGESIAISGDRMLIGAYGHTAVLGQTPGAAWVFERLGGTWTQVAKLEGTSGDPLALFGMAVALDGDVAAVAAPEEPTSLPETGALYVYERLGGEWTQRARLELPHARSFFGLRRTSVAVSGRRVVLGAPTASQVDLILPELFDGLQNGAAFVVEEVDGTWTHTATLRAGDATVTAAFGASVATEGGRILVGATAATGSTTRTGAAYLFEETPLGWAQTAKLVAPDALGAPPGTGDRGGFDVALEGDLLAFSAPNTPTGALFETGAVYTALASTLPCPGQSLSPATELLSMSDGGSQVLAVQAGAAQAGRLCLLLGSATGSSPGLPVAPGVHLPLVPDPYFDFTLAILGGPPFTAGLSVLDAQGRATARFDLPPGVLTDPALFGVALHHAALVFDPALQGFTFGTNATRLRLVP